MSNITCSFSDVCFRAIDIPCLQKAEAIIVDSLAAFNSSSSGNPSMKYAHPLYAVLPADYFFILAFFAHYSILHSRSFLALRHPFSVRLPQSFCIHQNPNSFSLPHCPVLRHSRFPLRVYRHQPTHRRHPLGLSRPQIQHPWLHCAPIINTDHSKNETTDDGHQRRRESEGVHQYLYSASTRGNGGGTACNADASVSGSTRRRAPASTVRRSASSHRALRAAAVMHRGGRATRMPVAVAMGMVVG
ncbi:hypothetical protein B0H14DRAFT_1393004 [Mycena olivaceomarginata]|nr:hypothetical protein B0H14DRAFT_1393004 [Mycena olivaceomarginata]